MQTTTIEIRSDDIPPPSYWCVPKRMSVLTEAVRALKPGEYFFASELGDGFSRGAYSSAVSRETQRRERLGLVGRVRSRTTDKGVILFCE